jgi:hypothetical protein
MKHRNYSMPVNLVNTSLQYPVGLELVPEEFPYGWRQVTETLPNGQLRYLVPDWNFSKK